MPDFSQILITDAALDTSTLRALLLRHRVKRLFLPASSPLEVAVAVEVRRHHEDAIMTILDELGPGPNLLVADAEDADTVLRQAQTRGIPSLRI